MRIRSVLILTAVVSSILGAIAVYLVLTVPNDLHAATLLKQARDDMRQGNNDRARSALSRIVQQYPRTDAAAAATVALVKLADEDRQKLAAQLAAMQRDRASQKSQLASLTTKVDQLAATPAVTVPVVAPQPVAAPPIAATPPAAVKPAPAKPTAKKKAVVRHRSRHKRHR
jgi:hypothetical protein